jgi:adenylate cyclase
MLGHPDLRKEVRVFYCAHILKAAPASYYIHPGQSSAYLGKLAMAVPAPTSVDSSAQPVSAKRFSAAVDGFVQRRPFLVLFMLVLLSNAFGSFFSARYNELLIVNRLMDREQVHVFWRVAFPAYNGIAYPIGICLIVWLLWPMSRCRRRLRAKKPVPPAELEKCRKRLVNLPFYQVCINFLGWLPGAVVFPLLITGLGGVHEAPAIWARFVLSFVVSALLTTAQTFFLLEWFLIRYFYADFFLDARPSSVRGVIRIPFGWRLLLLWSALAVPLLALLLVALDININDKDTTSLKALAGFVTVIGGASGGFVFWLVGSDINKWVACHATATEQIEFGNYDVNIPERRPDEWGQLTDRFNDMASALTRAQREHETFGQFIGPEVRDDIMDNFPGLGGNLEEITVFFADIRGFTRRTTGQDPTKVVELLNRFLTLAQNAVESKGGQIDKFLGDGVMALFGARRRNVGHADQAVVAAKELLAQMERFNDELKEHGQQPLEIGIGIHTGHALVGCVGSTIKLPGGRERMRRAFTAIGETVNLAQRLEQLTKSHEGPILLSEQTRVKLQLPLQLRSHGAVPVPGYDGCLVVYQVTDR